MKAFWAVFCGAIIGSTSACGAERSSSEDAATIATDTSEIETRIETASEIETDIAPETEFEAETESEIESEAETEAETETESGIEDPALHDPAHLLDVQITLAPADWADLRAQTRVLWDILGPNCLAGPVPDPFSWFHADVTIDGRTVHDVGLTKKGFLGSLDPVRPSLRVAFDEFVPHQTFDGVTDHLTLNNGRQDPSRVRQCLAYDVFRAAGIAAPRCSFAHVTVNGEDLGIYANVEPVRKPFIRAHFPPDPDHADAPLGQLWEGQLSDFRDAWLATFEAKFDLPPLDPSPLQAVTTVLTVPDDQLIAALDAVVDLDGFFIFWATEVLVAHWDGYAANTNNFYVYQDPTRGGRLRFIPWGPDGAFTAGPAPIPGDPTTNIVYTTGALARRLYLHPEGRARYEAALRNVLTTAWDEAALTTTVDTWAALLATHRGAQAHDEAAHDLDDVRAFVAGRRAVLDGSLADPPTTVPELRGPPCASERGTITATFATTWGTLGVNNLFTTGSGTFEFTGPDIPAIQIGKVGAKCGEDVVNAPDRAQLVVAAEIVDAGFVAILFELDLDAFVSDHTDHALDPHVIEAYAYLINPQGQSQLLGILGAGTLRLDRHGTTPGAAVEGAVTATLFGIF